MGILIQSWFLMNMSDWHMAPLKSLCLCLCLLSLDSWWIYSTGIWHHSSPCHNLKPDGSLGQIFPQGNENTAPWTMTSRRKIWYIAFLACSVWGRRVEKKWRVVMTVAAYHWLYHWGKPSDIWYLRPSEHLNDRWGLDQCVTLFGPQGVGEDDLIRIRGAQGTMWS